MYMIWKFGKDFENYYMISDCGNVFSKHKNKLRLPQKHTDGYLVLLFCVNRIRYTKYIHRLIAEAFIPNPLNLPEVNHKNGIKTDNRIDNLEWCTHKENVSHAHKTGLIKNQVRGIDVNGAKLNEQQVLEIRELSKTMYGKAIAKLYNVKAKTIYSIIRRESWKHL